MNEIEKDGEQLDTIWYTTMLCTKLLRLLTKKLTTSATVVVTRSKTPCIYANA